MSPAAVLLAIISSMEPKLRTTVARKLEGTLPAAVSRPAMTRAVHSKTTMINTVCIRWRGLSCGPTLSNCR